MWRMYWFHTDETNLDPSQGTFFIYGGLVMTPDQMAEVHNAVRDIRATYQYEPGDEFKFHTKSRPSQIKIDTWRESKAEILRRTADIGIDMIVYVVHHGIAASQPVERRMEYALNAAITKFDMGYLAAKNEVGVVCVDRLDAKFGYDYLRQRFQQPVELPDGRKVTLNRVLHYSMSCDGASHISSVVDIALGGFRFCANAAMDKGNQDVAKIILPAVAKIIWGEERNGINYVGGRGFITYPKTIYSASYEADYKQLKDKLASYLAPVDTPPDQQE